MSNSKKHKGGTVRIDAEAVARAIEKCVRRFRGEKEKQYLAHLIGMMLMNNSIPIDLIDTVPSSPSEVGKTRFEQLYDAAMSVAFPGYREETLERLLGPNSKITEKTKIWRIVFPQKFKIEHVLIRADSYQEAFALACDYACRASLRTHGRIPSDLTVRVMFVTEKAIRRKLDMRWANRVNKRRQLQLVGRIFSPKETQGARISALGSPSDPFFRIAKYVDAKDLEKIHKACGLTRVSSVEAEIFKHEDGSD